MLKNLSKLSFINVLAQVISIAGFSVNSQLYGADVIGTLFVVLSYSSIISIVSSGYLEQAFFVEKNDDMYKYLMLLIVYLCSLISVLSGIFLSIIGVSYFLYIGLNIFSDCLLKTITSYNISKNKIMFISTAKLVFAPIIPLLYFLSYKFYGPNESYIIMITSIGSLCFSLLITIITLRTFNIRFVQRDFTRYKLFLLIFKRYIKFTKFSMTGEFMRTFAIRAPTIVLEKFFGKDIAGFYGIANRIVLAPIMILVGTMSQIYIQKISSLKKNNQRLFRYTKQTLLILLTATILGIFGFFLIGKEVLIIFLGHEFAPVYVVVMAMLPYAFSISAYTPIFSVFTVFEKQEFIFRQKFIILVLSVISFSISVMLNDFIMGLAIFSTTTFLTYSLFGYKSLKIVLQYDKSVDKQDL